MRLKASFPDLVVSNLDHCAFLGNFPVSPPTPPLTQHFSLSDKLVTMLG